MFGQRFWRSIILGPAKPQVDQLQFYNAAIKRSSKELSSALDLNIDKLSKYIEEVTACTWEEAPEVAEDDSSEDACTQDDNDTTLVDLEEKFSTAAAKQAKQASHAKLFSGHMPARLLVLLGRYQAFLKQRVEAKKSSEGDIELIKWLSTAREGSLPHRLLKLAEKIEAAREGSPNLVVYYSELLNLLVLLRSKMH